MTTYYVNELGNGVEDGLGPFTSFSMATFNSSATDGDTYYLIGTIQTIANPPAGSAGLPVIARGDDATFPGTLSPATGAGWSGSPAKSYFEIRGFTIVSTNTDAVFVNGDHYLIDSVTTTSAQSAVELRSDRSADDITISNSTLTPSATVALASTGIRWNPASNDALDLTNITIHANVIDSGGSYGVFLGNPICNGCDAWAITDNTITNNTNAGVRLNDANPAGVISDVAISGNYISGNNGALALYAISGSVTHNNLSVNAGQTGGANIFDCVNGLSVTDNVCNGNTTSTIDANGLLLDNVSGASATTNTGLTLYRNECSLNLGDVGAANSGCGIMVLGSINSKLVGNAGRGNKNGLWFSSANQAGTLVYQNTFGSCVTNGAHVDDTIADNQLTLVNNILVGADVNDHATAGTFIHTNNAIDGYLTVTPDATEITADPQLISSTDLRLQGTSPCVEAGTRWWGTDPPPNGQDGLRFSRVPAMGAYQPSPHDGATRSPLVLSAAAGVYDAGVDIAKVRAA